MFVIEKIRIFANNYVSGSRRPENQCCGAANSSFGSDSSTLPKKLRIQRIRIQNVLLRSTMASKRLLGKILYQLQFDCRSTPITRSVLCHMERGRHLTSIRCCERPRSLLVFFLYTSILMTTRTPCIVSNLVPCKGFFSQLPVINQSTRNELRVLAFLTLYCYTPVVPVLH